MLSGTSFVTIELGNSVSVFQHQDAVLKYVLELRRKQILGNACPLNQQKGAVFL